MQANQIYNKQLNKKDNLQKARKTDKNTQYQANLNVQKSENSEIFAKPIQLKNNNILLKIPESNIVIYQDRISYCLQQNRNKLTQEKEKTGQKGLSSITNLQTNFSLQQIFLEKSIYFSNSNLAFKYLEDKKIIKIIQLTRTARNQKINLQIKIQDKQTRSVLQQILKKKICQIGFQDQFQVIKQIGKGATSKVYLVVRRWDKKQFAAKIISLSDSQQKSYNTFINENRILKALKNPHIVSLEGLYISHKKELISVLQYLKGGSLLQQLRQRKINTKFQKLKAIKDITLGIQHMRQKRIVHRDLKLENIMVRINSDQTKDYVITDMGLSNWIGQKYIIYQKCGTPGYIAPQVLSMEKGSCLLSHSTDIFSLGVLFHYILMMEPLFPYNGNTKQLLRLNKIANFNLYIEKYHCLTKQQFALLRVTLQIQPQKRASAKQLVQVYVSNYQKYVAQIQNKKRSNYQIELFGAKRQKYTNNVNTQIAKQKSGASKQKSFNTNCKSQRSIQIIGQKNVSLTKKAINVNSSKQLKQMGKAQKHKFGQYLQKSQKSSSIDNAKKIVSRVIDKINFFSKSKDKDKNKSIDKNDKKLIKASNNDLNMNLNSSRLSGLKVKDIQKSRNQMKSYLDD